MAARKKSRRKKGQPRKSADGRAKPEASTKAALGGGGNVTLRDIGLALGVSHVTVSLALRDSPLLPLERRLQVQRMASEMGYRPNAMAAALAHLRRGTEPRPVVAALGWLNFWTNPAELRGHAEFDAYWRGANAAAEKLGYHLEEFVCDGKSLTFARLEEILISRGIGGLLLPPQRTTLPLEQFDWSNFSAMRFGRSREKPQLHIVTSDQVANARRAFNAVRNLGYKRVGFLDCGGYLGGVLFTAGFMFAQKFVPSSQRVPLFDSDAKNERDLWADVKRWIKASKPDAILTDVARAAEMLSKLGYRVPEDFGLAAMSMLDGHCDAGIDQHPEEIGQVAVRQLISLMHMGDRGEPRTYREILVEGSWVDGSMMPRRN